MNNLVKNSAHLLTANVVAQAIGLVVYPILTRLYAPEDFGLLNLFLSIGGLLTIFATGEYHNAIVLPKEEERANAVFHAGGLLVLGTSMLLTLTIPFSTAIANVFNASLLARWYWFIPLYVLAMGTWNLLNYYYIRKQSFIRISGYQLSQSILSSGVKIGLGYGGWLSGGLILGSVLAPIGSVVASMIASGKQMWRELTHINRPLIKEVAQEYKNFPKYSLLRSTLNFFSANMPAFLLTPTFGLTELGFFSMAMTLAFRPIGLIISSCYQTFYQRIADDINNHLSVVGLLRRFSGIALIVVVPSFLILYAILPWLTTLLLGDGWSLTATYIRVMLPWIAACIIGGSISFIPDIFAKQRQATWIEIGYTILRLIALAIGIWTKNFYLAIALYSLFGVCTIVYQIIWYFSLLHRYEQTLKDAA